MNLNRLRMLLKVSSSFEASSWTMLLKPEDWVEACLFTPYMPTIIGSNHAWLFMFYFTQILELLKKQVVEDEDREASS